MSELPKVSRQEFLKLQNSAMTNQFNDYSSGNNLDPPDDDSYFDDYNNQSEPPNNHRWLKF